MQVECKNIQNLGDNKNGKNNRGANKSVCCFSNIFDSKFQCSVIVRTDDSNRIGKLDDANRILQNDNQRIQSDNEKLENAVSSLQSDNRRLQDSINSLQFENKNLQANVNSLQNNNQELRDITDLTKTQCSG
ncbi:MAG: hypothetical protein LBQ98_06605 [Nitrososphaerota archaeon]|jgi:SMC interacting uncharacterized protein involved in chromosome segregation|nr:hypothetical protein [Nitrososphaerota archaeon]